MKNEADRRRYMAQELFRLGQHAKRENWHDTAVNLLQQAISFEPDSVLYLLETGDLLQQAGNFDKALEIYDKALILRQDLAPVHNNRGNALKMLGRFEEAVESYGKAAALNPESPEILTNMGVALSGLQRYEDAAVCYEKALKLKPDHASAHWNHALLLLTKGEFENGWVEYEWRWRVRNFAQYKARHSKPEWKGEDPKGRTILLWCEQGLGDTVQFIRYAPLVLARGARVVVQCQKELHRLLASSRDFGEVITSEQAVPAHDLQCSIMSLPYIFGTSLESVPSDIPYIRPDSRLVSQWKERVGACAGLRVGLVWAGKLWDNIPAAKSVDSRRSMNLRMLSPLADIPDVVFVSLQLGAAADQIGSDSPFPIVKYGSDIMDFSDSAAIIANLDLVISVDTSVAHVSGAMGKRTWLLSRYDSCWRWLLAREDSPWYPSLRLFRQKKAGDWAEVIERVAVALRHEAHVKSALTQSNAGNSQ